MVKKIEAGNLLGIEKSDMEVSFLGRLLWYTVTDLKITREQLASIFAAHGIDEKYLPNPISARDSFRRATKEAEQKRIEIKDDTRAAGNDTPAPDANATDKAPEKKGTKCLNLMVREVFMNHELIIRQLVREIVDGQNKRLDYRPIYELALEEDRFSASPLVDDISDIEKAKVEAIELDYEDGKINYNGRHLRDVVNKILFDCNKVAVRPSGGVYFTPIAYEETTLALQHAVSDLGEYTVTCEKSKMWSIPVIDVSEQRDMIQETLEDQVKNESQALIKEMAEIIQKGRKVTAKTAAQYIDRVKGLQGMVKEYEDMLEREIISSQANLEAAMQQALSLLSNQDAE
jgi:hypothetical protein